MRDVDRLLGIGSRRKRRPFRMRTKKIEWMRAAGRDPFGDSLLLPYCQKRYIINEHLHLFHTIDTRKGQESLRH